MFLYMKFMKGLWTAGEGQVKKKLYTLPDETTEYPPRGGWDMSHELVLDMLVTL